jgi:hypothetical protein
MLLRVLMMNWQEIWRTSDLGQVILNLQVDYIRAFLKSVLNRFRKAKRPLLLWNLEAFVNPLWMEGR